MSVIQALGRAERDPELARACEAANEDLDVVEIEKDFDGIPDEIAEPWK